MVEVGTGMLVVGACRGPCLLRVGGCDAGGGGSNWRPLLSCWKSVSRVGRQGAHSASLSLRLAPGTWGLSAQAGLSPLHPSPFLSLTLRSVAILTKSNLGVYLPLPGDKGGDCGAWV